MTDINSSKAPKPVKVMIGLPIAAHCFPAETVEALLNLKVPPSMFARVVSGQAVDKARNYLVRIALEQGVTHLFFLDDDNPPPPETLGRLLQADKDIITVPILTRNEPYTPCIFKKVDISDKTKVPGYVHIEKIDTSGGDVVQVDACGMACTLIKREVLEKLYPKYEGSPFAFTRDTIDPPVDGKNKRDMSEDVVFCERAKKEGFTVWCDTAIRPKHYSGYKYVQFNDSMIL